MNPWLAHVVELARGLTVSRATSPKAYKAIIARQLEADGWYVRARFLVPSRGCDDHYRGALDLVCWPPPFPDPRGPEHAPNPHISNRPPPILIDLDKCSVGRKTRAKLASFAYPCSGRVVILTQADDSPPCQGIDTIVCLGA